MGVVHARHPEAGEATFASRRQFESVGAPRGWVEFTPEPKPVRGTATAVGDTTEVPDGTVAEVLEWVGDDLDRARAAYVVERDGPKRRSTLIDALMAMLEPQGSTTTGGGDRSVGNDSNSAAGPDEEA